MAMIINNTLPVLMKGYPTESDKYDVLPAILSVSSEVGHFGDFVTYDGGAYKVVSSTTKVTDVAKVAGVLLATNVKLVTDFFGGSSAEAETRPGEAFNLCFKGAIALPVATGVDATSIVAGTAVNLTSEGKVTTATVASGSVFALEHSVFTGITYTNDAGELLAEVRLHF